MAALSRLRPKCTPMAPSPALANSPVARAPWQAVIIDTSDGDSCLVLAATATQRSRRAADGGSCASVASESRTRQARVGNTLSQAVVFLLHLLQRCHLLRAVLQHSL